MERELWPLLYQYLLETAKEVRQKYVQIQPWIIVATLLWAALHDRPICWACDPHHWDTSPSQPLRIPSEATMSRRVDSVATGIFWKALEQRLRGSGNPALLAFLDGKPLPIGGYSKDPDARWGRGAHGLAKGYKLHAVWSTGWLPQAWEVTPLNVSEVEVAHRLIEQLSYGGYLLADGEYDASTLYDQAFAHGYQLVAPFRKAKHPGGGKHYQSPHRLQSIDMMQHDFGPELYQMRTQIERSFGNATSFGGGLAPLPAWVRGLARVRTWVWAKLLINAVRILKHKDLRHRCKMLRSVGTRRLVLFRQGGWAAMGWFSFLRRSPAQRSDLHIVLYTRHPCPLCDEAETLLQQYQRRYGFRLETRDVDAVPEDCARHGNWVPVVMINGRLRFRGCVNPVLLQRILQAKGV